MNIGVGGMHIGAVLPLGPGVIPGYQTADDLLQGSMQPCWAPWMSVTQSPCWDWREGLFMCTLPPHRAGLGIDTDGLLSPPCLISLSRQVNDWNHASSNIIVIYFGCLHQNDNCECRIVMSRPERSEPHRVGTESLSEGKGVATCPGNEAHSMRQDERILDWRVRNLDSNLASAC